MNKSDLFPLNVQNTLRGHRLLASAQLSKLTSEVVSYRCSEIVETEKTSLVQHSSFAGCRPKRYQVLQCRGVFVESSDQAQVATKIGKHKCNKKHNRNITCR